MLMIIPKETFPVQKTHVTFFKVVVFNKNSFVRMLIFYLIELEMKSVLDWDCSIIVYLCDCIHLFSFGLSGDLK